MIQQKPKTLLERIKSRREGQAMVEFAVTSLMFLFLLSSIAGMGYAGYVWSVMQTAVNDASRWGSLTQGDAMETREQKITERVRTIFRQYGLDDNTLVITFPPFTTDGAAATAGAGDASHFYRLRVTRPIEIIGPVKNLFLRTIGDSDFLTLHLAAESMIRNEPFA